MKIEVVLINPPTPGAEVSEYLNIAAPPMGLAYLAAVLEKAGHSVEIIDAQALQLSTSQVRAQIEKMQPELIGATAITPRIYAAMTAIRISREVCPDAFTIIGGTHPSFLPFETLRECPQLDAVCIGEGERTILNLTETIEQGGDLSTVKGIAYRRDGEMIKNPPAPLITDLDSLPFPARHLLPMDKYTVLGERFRMAIVVSSRGCPYNCSFCSSSRIFGRGYRARSAKNTVDEIEDVVENFGVKSLEIADDTFTLDKHRVLDICNEIKRRNLDVNWACSARGDTVSKDLLIKMREAGCHLIFYGVESGSQRILDLMNKGEKLDQIVRAIRWTKEAGIEPYGSFILGFPGETKDEIEDTIKFSRGLGLSYAEFSLLTAFPGSPIYEKMKKENLLLTEDWSQYTAAKPNVVHPDISPEKLGGYLTKAYISFYLSLPVIGRHLIKGRLKLINRIAIDAIKNKLGILKSKVQSQWKNDWSQVFRPERYIPMGDLEI